MNKRNINVSTEENLHSPVLTEVSPRSENVNSPLWEPNKCEDFTTKQPARISKI